MMRSVVSIFGARALVAALMLVWASMAQAVTLSFDDYVGGTDMGAGPVATLEANDVAGGVAFTLTNNGSQGSFIGRLWMTYAGDTGGLGMSANPGIRDFGTDPWTVAGTSFDLNTGFWGPNRPDFSILAGESLTFTILGATLADLFGGPRGAMISIFDGAGGSARYAASLPAGPGLQTLSSVPLPASGVLLIGAFGLIAGLRRRRRA